MSDREKNIIETLREGNRELRDALAAANARAEAAEARAERLQAALEAIIFECGLHGMGDVSGLKITTMAQNALKGGEE